MGISGSQSASRGLSSGEKPPSVQWPIWVRSGCPEGPLSSRKLSKSGRVEVFEGPSGTESYPFSMLAKNSPDGTRLVRSTDTKWYLLVFSILRTPRPGLVTFDPHKYDNLSFTRQGTGIGLNKVRFRFHEINTIDWSRQGRGRSSSSFRLYWADCQDPFYF